MSADPGRAEARGPVMLPEWRIDASEFVESGPATALELTVHVTAGIDAAEQAEHFRELLAVLSEWDRELGGLGLVLDHDSCTAGDGLLTLLLRPRDIRWSEDRFTKMTERLPPQPGQPPEASGPRPDSELLLKLLCECSSDPPREPVNGASLDSRLSSLKNCIRSVRVREAT